jgi:hypothetical protein
MEITEFTRAVSIAAITAQIREAEYAQLSDIAPHRSPQITEYIESLNKALNELFQISV